MVKKILCLALFLVASVAVSAQEIQVQATPLHRFITQNQSLGHFLTSNFAEGTGSPYNYAHQPFPYQADIVPVVPGYSPRSDQGLLPLYRWQVHQSPRIYYYYSIYYGNHGSNYQYQGVAGYVLASSDNRGTPLQYWYSTNYGYYYTLSGEYPIWGSFNYHGVQYNLPVGGSFTFVKNPEIIDPCEGMEADRQECLMNNGRWNPNSCTCELSCRWCDQPLDY